jgi:mono/diheme cytochrome c family protein
MPRRRLFFASGLIVVTPLVLVLGCGPTGDDRDPHPAKSSVASDPAWVAGGSEEPEVQRGRDPEYGQMLYGNTCLACHGPRGQGMPNQASTSAPANSSPPAPTISSSPFSKRDGSRRIRPAWSDD